MTPGQWIRLTGQYLLAAVVVGTAVALVDISSNQAPLVRIAVFVLSVGIVWMWIRHTWEERP